ncbi:hypothetical protein [Streptomyces sp. NPDC088254]|uniref:hypothetical protein n=1 Tax=Streptomyces sp. NPDC088254 TaxID=3365847 RepID=UPI0037F37E95
MPEGAPEGAPDGAPEGAPDGAPLGIPDGAWHPCCPAEPPPEDVDDEESPEPQATRTRGESASSVTAGARRADFSARFMGTSSGEDEERLRRDSTTVS